jgi:hypothetical protein
MLDEVELKTTEAALAEISTTSDDGSPEYEVEAILNHKVPGRDIHTWCADDPIDRGNDKSVADAESDRVRGME